MEQLIILTKDGTTYSTAQDDGSELTSNIRFNITLLDHIARSQPDHVKKKKRVAILAERLL